jgi:hypothetical protein
VFLYLLQGIDRKININAGLGILANLKRRLHNKYIHAVLIDIQRLYLLLLIKKNIYLLLDHIYKLIIWELLFIISSMPANTTAPAGRGAAATLQEAQSPQ